MAPRARFASGAVGVARGAGGAGAGRGGGGARVRAGGAGRAGGVRARGGGAGREAAGARGVRRDRVRADARGRLFLERLCGGGGSGVRGPQAEGVEVSSYLILDAYNVIGALDRYR